jgi:hypothetical protein
MGLESHITQVLEDDGLFKSGYDFWFDNGLICKNFATAEKVIELLYGSNQFALPRRAEEDMTRGEVKIVFTTSVNSRVQSVKSLV